MLVFLLSKICWRSINITRPHKSPPKQNKKTHCNCNQIFKKTPDHQSLETWSTHREPLKWLMATVTVILISKMTNKCGARFQNGPLSWRPLSHWKAGHDDSVRRTQTNFSIQKAKPPKIISSLIKTSFAGWGSRNDLPSRHDDDKDDVYLILLLGNILYVV